MSTIMQQVAWSEAAELAAREIDANLVRCEACRTWCLSGGPARGHTDMRDGYATPYGMYCERCVAVCDHCGEYTSPTNLYYVADECWCDKCAYVSATLCDMCNSNYPDDRVTWVGGYGHVCEDCLDRDFGCCQQCGEVQLWTDLDEDGYCRNCREDESGPVHTYGFRPHKQFYGSGPLFYGIELEVEKGEEEIDIEHIVGDEKYLYAKYDGSLRDGVEFVSHPASLAWIREHGMQQWDEVLALRHKRCRSWNTSTCGMHIHMSAKAFTCLQLYKLLKFFSQNASFVARISGRTQESLERWASLDPTDDYRIMYKAHYKTSACRYVALNCTGETVECRIFRGSLNPKRFVANLEFMQAMYDFTSVSGLQDMTVDKFHDFVRENQQHYKTFWELHQVRF